MEEQTINIYKNHYNPTNNRKKYKLLTPKTTSSVRIIDVDVDETVINKLKKHKALQKETIMKQRAIYHDQGFIFASINNEMPSYTLYIKKLKIV